MQGVSEICGDDVAGAAYNDAEAILGKAADHLHHRFLDFFVAFVLLLRKGTDDLVDHGALLLLENLGDPFGFEVQLSGAVVEDLLAENPPPFK